MKKIEAILRPARLGAVKEALAEAGIASMTVSDVRGTGRNPDPFRGERPVLSLPPQVRLELTVRDEAVEGVIDILLSHARTGEEGDGKIFVLPALEARRIRTGEAGDGVL